MQATDRRADGRGVGVVGGAAVRVVGHDGRAALGALDVQTVGGAVRRVGAVVRDERVGVDQDGRRRRRLLLGRRRGGGRLALPVVVAQVVTLQRLGERQLLRMAHTCNPFIHWISHLNKAKQNSNLTSSTLIEPKPNLT